MSIKVGEKLPAVNVKKIGLSGPEDFDIISSFSSKKVILFAVPGAFTRTCSEKHLPGFVQNSDNIKAQGIDLIACLSVNDPFVMGAWAKNHDVHGKILMLADGNAEFTKAVGLTYDASQSGMGVRSLRDAMFVDNCVVKNLFLDRPKQFEKSSVESVLSFLGNKTN